MKLQALNKLLLAVEEFRKIDPQFPPQMAATFIFICSHDSCSVKDIGERPGHIPVFGVSKRCRSFSKSPLRQNGVRTDRGPG